MKKVNAKFLKASEYIDFTNQLIIDKCEEFKEENQSKEEYAKLAFEFVRDEIKHSADKNIEKITIKASDVLEEQSGLCFAKTHLLAALLRINNIPCGVCYQRLVSSTEEGTFHLHGFNAIYLKKHGWFNVDPKGENVEFCPPNNALIHEANKEGEYTDDYVYDKPHDYVTDAMLKSETTSDFLKNIPDDY